MADILFVGDVAIQSEYGAVKVEPKLQEVLSQYSYKVCNFEGPLGEGLAAAPKVGPQVLQHESCVKVVSEMGFSLHCLANNHIMDYGKAGLEETLRLLSTNPDGDCIGAGTTEQQACAAVIKEIDGIRVGFVCGAEKSFGVCTGPESAGHAWLFSDAFIQSIKETRKKCDVLILIAHAGLELLDVPLPEWRSAYRAFIDMGVDVVIGHHPHIVQGWESYQKGLIFYSLGNFLWKRRNAPVKDYKTIAVGLHVTKSEISYTVIPVEMKDGVLCYCDDGEYSAYLEGLCDQLKPENQKEYLKKTDDFCLNIYRKAFPGYLCAATGNETSETISCYIKQIVKSVLRYQKLNDLYVFHNTAVETNSWLCQRAIETRRKQNEK